MERWGDGIRRLWPICEVHVLLRPHTSIRGGMGISSHLTDLLGASDEEVVLLQKWEWSHSSKSWQGVLAGRPPTLLAT